jgi:hypothetical protein
MGRRDWVGIGGAPDGFGSGFDPLPGSGCKVFKRLDLSPDWK